MNLKEQIKKEYIPQHIAVIMDGNGRWAKKKGNPRIFGHRNALNAVRSVTEASAELGVKYLTLYAFSKENWNRPQAEVLALMSLLVSAINGEIKTLQENGIKLNMIGDFESLPNHVQKELKQAIQATHNNTHMTLNLALSYGARWEILQAVKSLSNKVKNNELSIEDISEDIFSQELTTQGMPDPELMIRTAGEKRISNFLLWQTSYAELHFTDVLWPDFSKDDLYKAIIDYQSRERRFGKISEQLSK